MILPSGQVICTAMSFSSDITEAKKMLDKWVFQINETYSFEYKIIFILDILDEKAFSFLFFLWQLELFMLPVAELKVALIIKRIFLIYNF